MLDTNIILITFAITAFAFVIFLLIRAYKKIYTLNQKINHEVYSSQQAAMIGSWDWDIKNEIIYFSETALKVLGLSLNKLIYTEDEFLALIYEPDRKVYTESIKSTLKSGKPFKMEIRFELNNPYKPWIESRGEIFLDEEQHAYRMIGMVQDISKIVIQRKIQVAMKDILKNIIEHEKLEQILAKICSAIHEIEPSIQAIIYRTPDKDEVAKLYHSNNFPQALIHIFNSITIHDDRSELMQTLKQIDSVCIESLNLLPTWQSANQVLNTLNISSYCGQSLLNAEGKNQGALCLYLQDVAIPSEIVQQIIDTASKVAEVAIDGQLRVNSQQKIQQQLYHSQKMDSIGHLAGGIAHDFNNILGSIVGYNSLAKKVSAKDNNEKLASFLNEVTIAAERARELISQMMIFSRSEPTKNICIDAVPVIKEVLQLVKSMLPSSIHINYHFESNISKITINPISLHQVIMNLLINAKDAIVEDVGKITISLFDADIEKYKCNSCHESFNGDFVCLVIKDTGNGIATDYIDRIFEPFFTTKDIGRGTGMGLSVVHGIMHEINGHISIESKSGKYTEIKLYFPTAHIDALSANSDTVKLESTVGMGNNEHIMVVDDDRPLSLLYEEILLSYGYKVSRFDNSQLALEAFTNNPQDFELIISDQTMPFLTGDDLAKQILAIRPEIPIIICTGFSEKITSESAKKIGIQTLLIKPVDMYELLDLISDTLEQTLK